jgi:hypothetical protein
MEVVTAWVVNFETVVCPCLAFPFHGEYVAADLPLPFGLPLPLPRPLPLTIGFSLPLPLPLDDPLKCGVGSVER